MTSSTLNTRADTHTTTLNFKFHPTNKSESKSDKLRQRSTMTQHYQSNAVDLTEATTNLNTTSTDGMQPTNDRTRSPDNSLVNAEDTDWVLVSSDPGPLGLNDIHDSGHEDAQELHLDGKSAQTHAKDTTEEIAVGMLLSDLMNTPSGRNFNHRDDDTSVEEMPTSDREILKQEIADLRSKLEDLWCQSVELSERIKDSKARMDVLDRARGIATKNLNSDNSNT
ncbi:hypothetical protein ACLMJK_001704 [Lecanora helva]